VRVSCWYRLQPLCEQGDVCPLGWSLGGPRNNKGKVYPAVAEARTEVPSNPSLGYHRKTSGSIDCTFQGHLVRPCAIIITGPPPARFRLALLLQTAICSIHQGFQLRLDFRSPTREAFRPQCIMTNIHLHTTSHLPHCEHVISTTSPMTGLPETAAGRGSNTTLRASRSFETAADCFWAASGPRPSQLSTFGRNCRKLHLLSVIIVNY
jgi:hypothetical protein